MASRVIVENGLCGIMIKLISIAAVGVLLVSCNTDDELMGSGSTDDQASDVQIEIVRCVALPSAYSHGGSITFDAVVRITNNSELPIVLTTHSDKTFLTARVDGEELPYQHDGGSRRGPNTGDFFVIQSGEVSSMRFVTPSFRFESRPMSEVESLVVQMTFEPHIQITSDMMFNFVLAGVRDAVSFPTKAITTEPVEAVFVPDGWEDMNPMRVPLTQEGLRSRT